MADFANPVGNGWLKLVAAADVVGVYPGTLYRWWHYRKLPEGVCVKVGNTLFFNERELKRFAGVRRRRITRGK